MIGLRNRILCGLPVAVLVCSLLPAAAEAQFSRQTKLVGTGAAAQGVSVSLSGDGNTAIVGGPRDNHQAGAFPAGAGWVFAKPVFGRTPG